MSVWNASGRSLAEDLEHGPDLVMSGVAWLRGAGGNVGEPHAEALVACETGMPLEERNGMTWDHAMDLPRDAACSAPK